MSISVRRERIPEVERLIRPILISGVLCLLVLQNNPARAWIYPEHRDIALRAIQKLDPARRAVLDKLWAEARVSHEWRLADTPADATQGEKPPRLDYAAWPAISGDHSCSAANLLHNVLETDWILGVADVAARLKIEIIEAGDKRYERINALRDSDIRLQRTDPEYATRAGSNNVHFLLARPYVQTSGGDYVRVCLSNGCELNALGAYAWYHMSALMKAARLARESLSPEERTSLAIAALADEAFGIHFLEDVFAAGHVAGTWGNAAVRKGTHDYYNEYGLEIKTWSGESAVLLGDAWMRDEDAERAAGAVLASLTQFLDAAQGLGGGPTLKEARFPESTPDSLNVCRTDAMPDRTIEGNVGEVLEEILRLTPVPGLSEGAGELPRFSAELGPFIGFAPAARAATVHGGFSTDQTTVGGIGNLELAVRIGLGLEGVMNESGDGLVFLDLGFRQDAPTTTKISDSPVFEQFGNILTAIPSRTAYTARLRMPFWLIPGDLILAAPFLLPTSPETFAGMAVVAGNGGLIPWQAGIASPFGRFQFMAGREVGISFYGYGSSEDAFLFPVGGQLSENATLVKLRTIQLDFPIVEYRPFRTFSLDQSSSLVLQLYGAVDIPTRVDPGVLSPGDPGPSVKSVWQFGLRMAFDWRYYW